LPRGVWKLVAEASGSSGETESEEVEAAAGDVGVVLRSKPGISLGGTVLDERGNAPSTCELFVEYLEDPKANGEMRTVWGGRFLLEGVLAGTVRVIATTSDGRLGYTAPLTLGPGESALDLAIVLNEAARLQLRFVGPGEEGWFEVRAGDALITAGSVEPGLDREALAPAGAVEIRLYAAAGVVPEIRQLTLRGGERVEIVWPGSR
jgi:hypothetical protein